jgi:hypothetical protein
MYECGIGGDVFKYVQKQIHCIENPIYVFPEKKLGGLSPNITFMDL